MAEMTSDNSKSKHHRQAKWFDVNHTFALALQQCGVWITNKQLRKKNDIEQQQ